MTPYDSSKFFSLKMTDAQISVNQRTENLHDRPGSLLELDVPKNISFVSSDSKFIHENDNSFEK